MRFFRTAFWFVLFSLCLLSCQAQNTVQTREEAKPGQIGDSLPRNQIAGYTQVILDVDAFPAEKARALVDRGRIYMQKLGLNERGRLDFNRALTLDPGCADAYYFRSLAYEYDGDPTRAVADMKEYIRLAPEDPSGPRRLRHLEAKLDGDASGSMPSPSAAVPTAQPVDPAPQAESGPPSPAPALPSLQETRLALVIGNGAYRNIAPLANPVNDARDMAVALARCGFEVSEVVNGDRAELMTAMRAFGDRLNREKDSVGLFFYAGHGLQVDGENYLAPIGVKVMRKYEVELECLKISALLGAMEEARNRLNIIILDACRNNPFRGFRSVERGLARMNAPTGSLLVYATAPGQAASDGPGRNGLYTSMLLKHLTTPGLRIEELLKRVRIDVVRASGHAQVPWESSSLMGDFYFAPAPAANP